MARIMSADVVRTRYRRLTAENYERRRSGQGRWKKENAAVEEWLRGQHGSVLDVPVGTGRFIPVYEKMGVNYLGVDVSEDMLAIARRRVKSGYGKVDLGSVFDLRHHYDTVICVRLLHLLSQSESGLALRQICGAAKKHVILTVRLADAPTANPCSTTHSHKWFSSTIQRLGWRVAEERVLSRAGWRVILLNRRK
jgi:ubiquinone/menaquinone biosynthesis C-methylase UbiE